MPEGLAGASGAPAIPQGISSGDMSEALTVLLGEQAKGLSPNVVSRLKAERASEYDIRMKYGWHPPAPTRWQPSTTS